MDAFNEWLYATSDWILFSIVCVLAFGGLFLALRWMLRGTPIDEPTRKELHDATEH